MWAFEFVDYDWSTMIDHYGLAVEGPNGGLALMYDCLHLDFMCKWGCGWDECI